VDSGGGGTVGISPVLLQAIAQTLSSAGAVGCVSSNGVASTALHVTAAKQEPPSDKRGNVGGAQAGAGTKQIIQWRRQNVKQPGQFQVNSKYIWNIVFTVQLSFYLMVCPCRNSFYQLILTNVSGECPWNAKRSTQRFSISLLVTW